MVASYATIVHLVCFLNVPHLQNICYSTKKKQETNDRICILSAYIKETYMPHPQIASIVSFQNLNLMVS